MHHLDQRDWIYGMYRGRLDAFLVERGGVKASKLYETQYSYGNLANVGTAVQIAVDGRLAAKCSGTANPYRSVDELSMGASAVSLPPRGERIAVTHKLIEAVVGQPYRVGDRFGPIPAAANATLGRAMRHGLIVPVTALLTVTRTIEQKYLRGKKALGAREDGRLDLASVVGVIPDNNGAALLHASHPQLEDLNEKSTSVIAQHEATLGMDLDPLRIRLIHLYAVWQELLEAMGAPIPIVQRAERRFDGPAEGSLTSEQLSYATEHEDWSGEIDAVFPREAVVLGESRIESLRGYHYRTGLGDRRISEPARFLRDVEKGLESLFIHRLRASRSEVEMRLEGADDVVRLEGHLIGPGGAAYRPVIVLSHPHAESVVYLIPAERAAAMTVADWDAVLAALAPLHGVASARSSDDQGLGVTIPYKHALNISCVDIDKACNYDAFRCFSHDMHEPSHWRPKEPPPDQDQRGDDAEAA
jgi:hypothetical protein